jgi:hypothetical protein
MENVNTNHDFADEKKSLQIIKATIAGSRKKLMDDGILLLLWGITFSIGNFWKYYESVVLTAWWMRNLMTVLQYVFGVGVILFTIYFLFFKKRKVTSFAAISTRYVWIGIILAHNIEVIITKNILNEVNFELLQPLQMVLIGFALFVTGGIYRYYVLVISGVIMWFAAALTANYELNNQFLIRTVAEIICFIVPGILMLNERKNKL